MNIEMGMGARLKQLRKQKKLTQKELACIIGIGQTAVANYENGRRFPDEKNLIRIADYFQISLDQLIGRDFSPDQIEMPLASGFSYTPSELGGFVDSYMILAQKSGSNAVNFVIQLLSDGFREEQIILDLLAAALVRAGEFWAEGFYNEAMEHQLSMTVVQSMLSMKALSEPVRSTTGRFTALPAAGELHNIGLRILSRFLEIDGWEGFFLGSSVPARSLAEFIDSNKIDLVLLSATLNENAESVCSLIKAAKAAGTGPSVIAGGRATVLNRERLSECGADHIFSSVTGAIEITRKIRTGLTFK